MTLQDGSCNRQRLLAVRPVQNEMVDTLLKRLFEAASVVASAVGDSPDVGLFGSSLQDRQAEQVIEGLVETAGGTQGVQPVYLPRLLNQAHLHLLVAAHFSTLR